jgi:hypothetical protein
VFAKFAFGFPLDVSIIAMEAILEHSAYMNIHPTHFYPEEEDGVYLRNVGNTAHIYAMQRPKSRISIKISTLMYTSRKRDEIFHSG